MLTRMETDFQYPQTEAFCLWETTTTENPGPLNNGGWGIRQAPLHKKTC